MRLVTDLLSGLKDLASNILSLHIRADVEVSFFPFLSFFFLSGRNILQKGTKIKKRDRNVFFVPDYFSFFEKKFTLISCATTFSIITFSIMTVCIMTLAQHNGLICDSQHKGHLTQMIFSSMIYSKQVLSFIMLSVATI